MAPWVPWGLLVVGTVAGHQGWKGIWWGQDLGWVFLPVMLWDGGGNKPWSPLASVHPSAARLALVGTAAMP